MNPVRTHKVTICRVATESWHIISVVHQQLTESGS